MPALLDLFARAQGAAVGYARAGFDVTASDIDPYPRHPEVSAFVVADALELLDDVAWCRTFDVITASPPCQGYSVTRSLGKGAPMLIDVVREKLARIGRPYVIENVAGARSHMIDPLMLCGSMFDLGAVDRFGVYRSLRRHRLFESSVQLEAPWPCDHSLPVVGVYGLSGGYTKGQRGYKGATVEAQAAMGIDWMRYRDLSQAIPPAYTEYIGRSLLRSL